MKKLLKLFGVGLLGGAGTRFGIMLMDAFFPNGLGGFLSRFTTQTNATSNQTTGSPPIRGLQSIFGNRGQ